MQEAQAEGTAHPCVPCRRQDKDRQLWRPPSQTPRRRRKRATEVRAAPRNMQGVWECASPPLATCMYASFFATASPNEGGRGVQNDAAWCFSWPLRSGRMPRPMHMSHVRAWSTCLSSQLWTLLRPWRMPCRSAPYRPHHPPSGHRGGLHGAQGGAACKLCQSSPRAAGNTPRHTHTSTVRGLELQRLHRTPHIGCGAIAPTGWEREWVGAWEVARRGQPAAGQPCAEWVPGERSPPRAVVADSIFFKLLPPRELHLLAESVSERGGLSLLGNFRMYSVLTFVSDALKVLCLLFCACICCLALFDVLQKQISKESKTMYGHVECLPRRNKVGNND